MEGVVDCLHKHLHDDAVLTLETLLWFSFQLQSSSSCSSSVNSCSGSFHSASLQPNAFYLVQPTLLSSYSHVSNQKDGQTPSEASGWVIKWVQTTNALKNLKRTGRRSSVLNYVLCEAAVRMQQRDYWITWCQTHSSHLKPAVRMLRGEWRSWTWLGSCLYMLPVSRGNDLKITLCTELLETFDVRRKLIVKINIKLRFDSGRGTSALVDHELTVSNFLWSILRMLWKSKKWKCLRKFSITARRVGIFFIFSLESNPLSEKLPSDKHVWVYLQASPGFLNHKISI